MSDLVSKDPATPPRDQLSGHEYDGIQEYDNPMPRWWVWIFWGTFYFALCYFLWFNVYFKGTPVTEEYAQDMVAYRAVGDIGGQVEDGNWVESSGVEHDELAPADKVLTGRAHAQLDGLRGRVAIYATDDLFDLHLVKRGIGGGL